MKTERGRVDLVYTTPFGRAYKGDARKVLGRGSRLVKPGAIDLIFTSPPYALTRPKDYGNEAHADYLKWFATFLPGFKRALSPTGSLVVDIGGSWLPGAPRRSTYHFALALLLERHLQFCQEFYWYNPSKLPSPAEWVTRQRARVKDSVNLVLWFAKDASRTKANNRAVQRRYSESMRSLLRGGYQTRMRPSNHNITDRFMMDNGGSIPSNLLGFTQATEEPAPELEGEPFETWFDNILAIANTSSNDRYLKECRAHGIKPHGARFPVGLPAFFIEFLTETGDLVCDPFAGSNTTGQAAEALKRRWVSIDLDQEGESSGTYVRTSAFRFDQAEVRHRFRGIPEGNWVQNPRHVGPDQLQLSLATPPPPRSQPRAGP